jgi:hypothetical protein
MAHFGAVGIRPGAVGKLTQSDSDYSASVLKIGMRCILTLAHVLFGKPVSTPGHALGAGGDTSWLTQPTSARRGVRSSARRAQCAVGRRRRCCP